MSGSFTNWHVGAAEKLLEDVRKREFFKAHETDMLLAALTHAILATIDTEGEEL